MLRTRALKKKLLVTHTGGPKAELQFSSGFRVGRVERIMQTYPSLHLPLLLSLPPPHTREHLVRSQRKHRPMGTLARTPWKVSSENDHHLQCGGWGWGVGGQSSAKCRYTSRSHTHAARPLTTYAELERQEKMQGRKGIRSFFLGLQLLAEPPFGPSPVGLHQ